MWTSSVQKGLRRLCEIAYGNRKDRRTQKYIAILEMCEESICRMEQYLLSKHKDTGDITSYGSA